MTSPATTTRRCSSCGSRDRLQLVTVLMVGPDVPGRLLVYCHACRRERADMIDVSIPVELVDERLFVALYALGRTESDPVTASDIAFGGANEKAAAGAQRALDQAISRSRPRRT